MVKITEKENEKKTIKFKINKKKMIRSLCILILSIYVLHVFLVHFVVNRYNECIYPGVKVEGINLSGKTEKEAVDTLKHKYVNEALKKNILIKAGNKVYKINYSKLNMNYNIEDTVKDAFKYGKKGSIYDKYKIIRSAKEKQFSLKYSYNKSEAEEIISKIENDFDKKPIDAKITRDKNDKFQVTSEKQGQEIDKDKLIEDMEAEINSKDTKDVMVNVKMKEIQPVMKKSDLKKIDTKISSFTTDFSSSTDSRANNINVAAKSLDGITIMPNQIFSFNNIVGERTEKRGYQAAGVIVGDKLESGFGGGVCQVSSTLHNAVVRAGIVPIERDHHNLPVSYVELGMDATVDYGNIDYKFKNTLNYPIYIECLVEDGNLTFNIYSNSKLTEKTYNLVNSVKTTKEDNKTVLTVKAYKVTYKDGKQISKQEINTDKYRLPN
ncbi:VanW family protein [Clostridium ljungdahlii]|uniref:VanW family protein n=1 Tax=Clostridium ljungdahlii TaxID=1538 RepID=UPI003865C0FE